MSSVVEKGQTLGSILYSESFTFEESGIFILTSNIKYLKFWNTKQNCAFLSNLEKSQNMLIEPCGKQKTGI